MDLFDDSGLYVLIPLILFGVYWFFLKPKPPPKIAPTITPVTRRRPQKTEDDSATGVKVKILYASQTGTAEEFSHKLGQEAKRFGFAPKIVDIENLDRDELPQETFIIILAATYGEGEPTDNAREFHDWIVDESLDSNLLNNVQYTVFGLGNKTYEHYNAIGRLFDKRLEAIGAKRIFKLGEGDEDASLEDDFAAWKKELWPALVQHFNIQVDLNQKEDETTRRFKLKSFDDLSVVSKNARANIHKHLCKKDVRTVDYDLKNPFIAKVVENRELHTSSSDRSCRHVEIDIETALKYEPGDRVGIFPENDPREVEEISKRLEIDLDKVFALIPVEEGSTKPFLGPCTYRQAFLQWSDLTNPPRKSVLRVFAHLATDPKEKKRLEVLSDEEKAQPYNKWVKDDFRSVCEILREFPSVKITADHLIEILPKLTPRLYSISSSLKTSPGKVTATCVVVQFKTLSGRDHNGVASNWLTRQIPTESVKPNVYIYIDKSKFRLPKDGNTPIVMIGPGTGVAPFRSFLHERSHGNFGENYLFFGCRSKDIDFIYREELEQFQAKNHLKLFVAFSRDQAEKVYVQHVMRKQKDLIWDKIHNQKGYFYVCGDARVMAKDVQQALVETIMEKKACSEEEANEYIKNLTQEGRYQTDVWY